MVARAASSREAGVPRLAVILIKPLDQLEGQSGPTQLREGVAASRQLGVDHRLGLGEGRRGKVVVGNNHVGPQPMGLCYLGHGAHAAVYRDHQGYSLLN